MGSNPCRGAPDLEPELGADHTFLRISDGNPEDHLHDERGRVTEHDLA